MKVTYIFRSSKLNAFSIENVFNYVSKEVEKKCNIEKVFLPEPKYSLNAFIKNLIYVRNLNADVYHITGDVHYICATLPGKKTILTIHDLRARERLAKKYFKKFLYDLVWVKYPVRNCALITAISEKTKREILEVCPWATDKIVVIPDPISSSFSYAPKEFNVEKPRLLFLGTKGNKNHMRMLEAVKDISCVVDIIGKIPPEEQDALNKYNIEYENSFNLSEEELIQKYIDSDIVMFASTYEGFGMPIVEGQTVGRPVLTSDLSPMKEVAGKGACIVDPYDVESIRKGVNRIILDKKYRSEIVEQGLENAMMYTAEKIGDMYYKLYQNL